MTALGSIQSTILARSQKNLLSIKDLFSILEKINPEDVNIKMAIFKSPLYSNTVLDRQDVLLQTSAVILRKNLYFLAKKTVDVYNFINELVQMGLLHLDDRARIVNMEDETMQALECYIKVVQGNHSFDNLLHVLRVTNNMEILSMLELRRLQEKSDTEQPTSSGLQMQKRPGQKLPFPKPRKLPVKLKKWSWSCKRCTFENENFCENCEMCGNSKNVDAKELEGSNECPQCTLVNFAEVTSCDACGFKLTEESE